jgi:hypothetical protein
LAAERANVSKCVFEQFNECGLKEDALIEVEMNLDAKGHFHGLQDHLNQARRVSGVAHLSCYKDWYEETYKTPFTMSS